MKKYATITITVMLLFIYFLFSSGCHEYDAKSSTIPEGIVTVSNPDADYILLPQANGTYQIRIIENVKQEQLLIPDYCGEYKVTKIASAALRDCDIVKEIVIPDTVETIEMLAFYACSNIEKIHIGSNVRDLNRGAFAQSFSLKKLSISKENAQYYVENDCLIERETKQLVIGTQNSVIPSDVLEIGDSAFEDMRDIKKIEIPSGVLKIGAYAFAGTELADLHIPNTVVEIGEYAFGHMMQLEEIVIPDSVIALNYRTFFECWNLKHVKIGKGCANIDPTAFYSCKALESIEISAQNSVYYVENNCIIEFNTQRAVFSANNAQIPIGVKTIGSLCISKKVATEVEAIIIPASVAELEYSAISAYCGNIKYIYIPKSVLIMSEYAIELKSDGAKIYCEAFEKPTGWDEKWLYSGSESAVDIVWGYDFSVLQE